LWHYNIHSLLIPVIGTSPTQDAGILNKINSWVGRLLIAVERQLIFYRGKSLPTEALILIQWLGASVGEGLININGTTYSVWTQEVVAMIIVLFIKYILYSYHL